MTSKTIEAIIEKLAEQYPNSDHSMSVEDFAYWLQKNAPEAPRQEPAGFIIPGDLPSASGYTKTLNPVPEGKYTMPVYAAPLSPDHSGGGAGVVAAQSFAKGFNTFEQVGGDYKIVMKFAGRDDAWAAYNALCKLTDGRH